VVTELTIDRLDALACGVGLTDGGGVELRVPFALPGERVRVRVWRQRESTGEADLVEVLTPSPARVAPACVHFGVCGGCQLQHLPYADQLTWKTDLCRGLLAPLGLDATTVRPCAPSPRPLGYRSKITPHHQRPRPDRPLRIGFLKAGRRGEVVDVDRCPLATDGINACLPALRSDAAARAGARRRGATLLVRDSAAGVTSDPDAEIEERVGALALRFYAREFFQNNPFLLPALVEAVVEGAASGGASRLVDAYSGSGLFALAAAGRFAEVVGVEVSPAAVAAAAANAARNGVTNARFVVADAAAIFAALGDGGAASAVIVDPPRKGCGPAFLQQLITFAPRTVVYVSCNPEALAADLGRLLAAGYRTASVQPFDMFPQTRHLECVAVLKRTPQMPLTPALSPSETGRG
jgi:tRNA/tmRNA/rRNA uracil-C5-methylase (TrmA/RlmC/RlmD family)